MDRVARFVENVKGKEIGKNCAKRKKELAWERIMPKGRRVWEGLGKCGRRWSGVGDRPPTPRSKFQKPRTIVPIAQEHDSTRA